MRQAPSKLIFNRKGIEKDCLEYEYGIYIDIDGNSASGDKYFGAEYYLGSQHFAAIYIALYVPVEYGRQTNVWKYNNDDNEGWTNISGAIIKLDESSNTVTLSGKIPDINTNSKSIFITRVKILTANLKWIFPIKVNSICQTKVLQQSKI